MSVRWFIIFGTKNVICVLEFTIFCYALIMFLYIEKKSIQKFKTKNGINTYFSEYWHQYGELRIIKLLCVCFFLPEICAVHLKFLWKLVREEKIPNWVYINVSCIVIQKRLAGFFLQISLLRSLSPACYAFSAITFHVENQIKFVYIFHFSFIHNSFIQLDGRGAVLCKHRINREK